MSTDPEFPLYRVTFEFDTGDGTPVETTTLSTRGVAVKLGDMVQWTSQAGGCTRTKRGAIVAVVPAGTMPDTRKVSRYGGGMARDHESYLVKVPGKGTYWPRVNALELIRPSYKEKIYRILRDYQDAKFTATSGVAVGQLTIELSTVYDKIIAAVREERS